MGRIFIAIYHFFKRHTLALFVLLTLLVGFEIYSIYKAKFSEDITALLPQEEGMEALSNLVQNSKLADQIIIHFALRDTSLQAPDSLMQVASLMVDSLSKDTSNIANIKYKIDDEAKMQAYQFFYDNLHLYLDTANYKQIAERLTKENIEQTLSKNLQILMSPSGMFIKRFILQDPLSITPMLLVRLNNFKVDEHYLMYKSCIFSQDKKHLLVFVEPKHSASDIKKNEILLQNIEALTEDLSVKYPNVEIGAYGGPVVALGNSKRVKKDVAITVSLALLLLVGMFLFVFRNLHIFNLLFIPIVLGAGLAFAILTFIMPTISVLSLGVGAILMGIAIDYSLHLFTHYRSSGNIISTFKDVAEPILISCLTTASTFLCLFVVKSQVLTQLGLFVALSVFFTTLFVLILIPQYLRFVKLGKKVKMHHTFVDRFAQSDLSKNKWLLYVIIVLTIVFVFTSRRLSFNGDIASLNYLSDKVRHLENTLKQISPDVLSSVTIVTEGTSLDEALLKSEQVYPIINKLKQEGKVKSYVTVNDIMLSKEKQQQKIKQWEAFWSGVDTLSMQNNFVDLGKKYHFKKKTFVPFFNKINGKNTADTDFSSMRELLLNNYISKREDGKYRLFSIVKMDAKYKANLFDKIEQVEGIQIFDKAYYTNMFFKVLKRNFNLLVSLSMLLVFSILWLAFGRIELALITYLPIVLSWIWTIGMMGLFGVEFNIFSIIISTFVFGLGIDYSIFLLRGLQNNYQYGNTEIAPYRMSIILSVWTTLSGVGVLILAEHPALKSIALVSIFGIVSVVFVTFVLLPRLFSFLVSSNGKRRTYPVVMLDLVISVGSFSIFLCAVILVTLFIPLFIITPVANKKKKAVFSYILYLFSNMIVKFNFTIKRIYVDKEKFDLSSPKVIIANHQSHLDLVLLLMLNPKIVVLTNKWVWNNPFYGIIIRYAGFYSVTNGVDKGIGKLKEKVADGYSVLVFPEGTRSVDGTIKRFHQGAFKLANDLGLDILPVLIRGAYECLPKTEFVLHSGNIALKFYDAIKVESKDVEQQETYRKEAKELTYLYRNELQQLKEKECDTHFYRRTLISKYIYKGPVLEWYLRVKIRLEKDYELFESLIPKQAKIVDVGCGYGFLANMLKLTGDSREILGIDYDAQKIAVAQNVAQHFSAISFKTKDILTMELSESEVFILSDVLHYMPIDLQEKVMQKCIDSLSSKGIIIVRDANADYQKRTKGTKLTEWFSTKLLGFNKTNYDLEFASASTLKTIAAKNNLSVEVIDTTKYTSNIIHIIKRKADGV